MGYNGVNTETAAMQQAANRAADTAEQLDAAVKSLTGQLHGHLSSLKGQIAPAFWQNHEQHVSHTARLTASLRTMGQGINSSSSNYENTDQESASAQHRAASAASGLPVGKLL